MSETTVRASLVDAIQTWLDKEADDIGATFGIWQDESHEQRNAEVYATAVMTCIEAAVLQDQLNRELNGE